MVDASERVPRSLEPVEDQIEPQLELVRVVVAGPQDVLDGHLREVRVRAIAEHDAGDTGRRRWAKMPYWLNWSSAHSRRTW